MIQKCFKVSLYLLMVFIFACTSRPASKSKSKGNELKAGKEVAEGLAGRMAPHLEDKKHDTALVGDIESASKDTSPKDAKNPFQLIYSLASAEVSTKDNDKTLIEAQEQVFLSRENVSHHKYLVSVAVDREADAIVVFGLGRPPSDASSPLQARLLARRAAIVDAYRWVGHAARWVKEPEAPFSNLSADVKDTKVINEFWVPNQLYMVKVIAPLSSNLP